MGRTLLIAQREYMAYARTVGFWLSLLALPLFAVLGGFLPVLMERAEPVRTAALIEAAPDQTGGALAQAVREALAAERQRDLANALRGAAVTGAGVDAAEGVHRVAREQGYEAGLAELRRVAPRAGAGFTPSRPSLELVEVPSGISAAPADERQAAMRPWLEGERTLDDGRELDAVAILSRTDDAPSAIIWSASASDRTVENAIRDALVEVNRLGQLRAAGVDPDLIREAERFRPEVQMFSPASVTGGEVSLRDRLPGMIGFGLGMVLWAAIFTGASILLNSVMEEKASRVLEVLLASASSAEILAGKVLGVAMLTGTVLLVWGGLGAMALQTLQPEILRDIGAVLMEGGLIFYFIVYLLGGYLMYAVVFAAIGAFCETPREAQTLMGPLMMVLFVPIFVMQLAIRNPDVSLIKALSWVPFFTPFLMTARAPSDPPIIEIAGTMEVMVLTAAIMVWLAGKAFRAGALSNAKLDWKSLKGLFGR